jgi:NADH-quinone oxidoreductase subunit N
MVKNATGKVKIDDYNGFYQTNPRLSLVMMLALFSLAGIPPVAGFFGKFFLFAAAAGEGHYWLVLIAVINTIVSLYYYLLVVKAMFLNRSESPIETIKGDGLARLGLIISVLGILIIGFYSPVFDWVQAVSFGL